MNTKDPFSEREWLPFGMIEENGFHAFKGSDPLWEALEPSYWRWRSSRPLLISSDPRIVKAAIKERERMKKELAENLFAKAGDK